MPNDESGLPNPHKFSDEPPPYIEGLTGGPAMPTGGSQWSKEGAADWRFPFRRRNRLGIRDDWRTQKALGYLDDLDAAPRPGGYVESSEAAWSVIETVVTPYFHDLERLAKLRHEDEAFEICKGIVLGLYRAEHRGFELLEYAEDSPSELAGHAVEIWRRRRPDWTLPRDFVEKYTPNWALARSLTRRVTEKQVQEARELMNQVTTDRLEGRRPKPI